MLEDCLLQRILKIEWSFLCKNLSHLYTRICFVPSLVEMSQVVVKKCEILSMYLCYFIFIPPWKRTWPLMNPHYSRMSCEIGPEVLEEIKIKIRWMDIRWSEKLTCAFSSGELKIHYSLGFFQGVGVVVCVWCGVGHNYNYIYV